MTHKVPIRQERNALRAENARMKDALGRVIELTADAYKIESPRVLLDAAGDIARAALEAPQST